jgi:hypothetical protein
LSAVAARLGAETVEGAALALESVDDVERGDGLALGVLSVGDRVADNVLKEGLEDGAGLLVDEARNTLDTTTASETADSGLGNTPRVLSASESESTFFDRHSLDVVTKDLAVTLGAALAETLATLSTAGHC